MSAARLPRVFVTRAIDGAALDRLRGAAQVDVWEHRRPPTSEELAGQARDVDGLLTMLTDRVDEQLLHAARRLRVVANMAVGHDNLDTDALTARQIPAGNTPGVLTEATADLAWSLLLAAGRHVVTGDRLVRDGGWKTWEPDLLTGLELEGATLGIIGFGAIGAAVARRAVPFGMRVIAWTRSPKPDTGVTWMALDDVIREADVFSIHCALTPETRHLIGARELRAMKSTALLINTARGPIVDQRALAAALHNGEIGGAALDVFDQEPLPADDPLLGAPNCLLLPHLGSATTRTRRRMAELAVDNIIAGLRGHPLPHCINAEVYATA